VSPGRAGSSPLGGNTSAVVSIVRRPTGTTPAAVPASATRSVARLSRVIYPTLPAISSWISRLSSTAYSSGSSLAIGSMKPLTIRLIASPAESPRLRR
jgi:hypothetical protein